MQRSIALIVMSIAALSMLLSNATSPISANADDEKGRLEEEVRSLRVEVANLKRELAIAKVSLEKARAAGFVVSPGYASAAEILAALPDELQPHIRLGWDKLKIDEVYAWLKQEPIGEPFSGQFVVASVQVEKNVYHRTDSSRPPWIIKVFIEAKDFKHRGVTLTQKIGENWPQPLRIYGNDELVRDAEKVRKGHSIRVSGKIKQIVLGSEVNGRREFHIGLTDYSIASTILTK